METKMCMCDWPEGCGGTGVLFCDGCGGDICAHNACSMLYATAWKAAKALGYRRLITYTLPEEGGASLRASGWKLIGERGGGNWNVKSRPRIDTAQQLAGQKLLWEAA